jgi:hypothetical protein
MKSRYFTENAIELLKDNKIDEAILQLRSLAREFHLVNFQKQLVTIHHQYRTLESHHLAKTIDESFVKTEQQRLIFRVADIARAMSNEIGGVRLRSIEA